ncbi:ABC transporter ATP-binding protein [Streptomyces sp. NPDC060194]|uniref:ABC transporter ATP-binding protein n=1 Tax=Streptomyces sp. NPDC060194 TaxID=3347069 RepID=UPI00364DE80B
MIGHAAALRTTADLARRAAPLALCGAVAVAVVESLLPVSAAWLTKDVIDSLAAPQGASDVAPAAVLLAVATVAAAVLPHVGRLFRGELGRGIGLLAQDRLYERVNGYTGLGRFEDPEALDRLRLAQQCGQDTPPQVVDGIVGLGRSTVMILGFLASLAVIEPWLAPVVVLSALPSLRTEIRTARHRVGAALTVTPLERRESFYGFLLGSVQTAKEIRLFGIGDHLRARMRHDRRTIDATHRRLDRRTAAAQILPAVVTAATGAGCLLWAVLGVARGALTVGDVALLLAGVAAVQGGLAGIAVLVAVTHQHLLLLGHYVAVTTAPPDLPVPRDPLPVGPLTGRVELRDVWFRYSERHDWVLRGVDLTVPVGGTVALVGLNGAGKSTVVKLLCRFYDPERGAVLWDGVDVRSLDPRDLRRRMSGVFQDFMHYDLTAAENIGLGDLRHADDPERIRTAARRAGVDGLLSSLPRGYDTMLSRSFAGESRPGEEGEAADGAPADDPTGSGPVGVELSGGQWQRVGLARAFLRDDSDLLVLDEPSSGLDPEAEHEIHRALVDHRRGRTSLLISHRLNTVRGADLIVVLHDGKVVEQGDHDALMAADGRYAGLFRRQAAGYADAPPAAVG